MFKVPSTAVNGLQVGVGGAARPFAAMSADDTGTLIAIDIILLS